MGRKGVILYMRATTPMDKNSTLLLSYFEITNTPSDLIADAFGIDAALSILLPDMEDNLLMRSLPDCSKRSDATQGALKSLISA